MPDLNSLPSTPSRSRQPSRTPSHSMSISANSNANLASTPPQMHDPASRRDAPSASPHRANISAVATNSTPALPPSAHSLAAAATMNAGVQSEDRIIANSSNPSSGSLRRDSNHGMIPPPPSRRERRRSSIRMSLSLNDPTLPGPGELAMSPGASGVVRGPFAPVPSSSSPGHRRTPSLGELHQELESEQEAQVNRLLGMIRRQQEQIQALQQQGGAQHSAVEDGSNAPSEASRSHTPSLVHQAPGPVPVPGQASQPRSPFNSLSRHSSYRGSGLSSHDVSPLIRPISGSVDEFGSLGSSARDESAFYQAETQNFVRENQMLKLRIRELERQLNDLNSASPVTHSPATASNLHTSVVCTPGNGAEASGAAAGT